MKFGFANVFFTLEIRVQPERVKEIKKSRNGIKFNKLSLCNLLKILNKLYRVRMNRNFHSGD
jgi:hypothetical protein